MEIEIEIDTDIDQDLVFIQGWIDIWYVDIDSYSR